MQLRESLNALKANLPRYGAMALACALLVCLFAGPVLAGGAERARSNDAWQAQGMADLLLSSSIGFEQDQITALSALPEVAQVRPVTYRSEAAVLPLPPEAALVSGRLPVADGECVVTQELGSIITLRVEGEGDSAMSADLLVVGVVDKPAAYAQISGGLALVPTARYASASYANETALCDALSVELHKDAGLSRFSASYAALLESETSIFETLCASAAADKRASILEHIEIVAMQAELDLEAAETDYALAGEKLAENEALAADRQSVVDNDKAALTLAEQRLSVAITALEDATQAHEALAIQYDDYATQARADNERLWTAFRNQRNKYNDDVEKFRAENPGSELPASFATQKTAIDNLQQQSLDAERAFSNQSSSYERQITDAQALIETCEQERQAAQQEKERLEQTHSDSLFDLAMANIAAAGNQRDQNTALAQKKDAEQRIALAQEQQRLTTDALWQVNTLADSAVYVSAQATIAKLAYPAWPALLFGAVLLLAVTALATRSAALSNPREGDTRNAIGAPSQQLKYTLCALLCAAVMLPVGALAAYGLAGTLRPEASGYLLKSLAGSWATALLLPCFAVLLLSGLAAYFVMLLSARPLRKPLCLSDEIPALSFLQKGMGLLEKRAFLKTRKDTAHMLSLALLSFALPGLAVLSACAFAVSALLGVLFATAALLTLIAAPMLNEARARQMAPELSVLHAIGISGPDAAALLTPGNSAIIAVMAVFSLAVSLATGTAITGRLPLAAWPAGILPPVVLWLLLKASALRLTSGHFSAN